MDILITYKIGKETRAEFFPDQTGPKTSIRAAMRQRALSSVKRGAEFVHIYVLGEPDYEILVDVQEAAREGGRL